MSPDEAAMDEMNSDVAPDSCSRGAGRDLDELEEDEEVVEEEGDRELTWRRDLLTCRGREYLWAMYGDTPRLRRAGE
jgi:hypothetical protein